MVTQTYDTFNRQEKPEIILCNPNKEELYSLKAATRTLITMRYNAASEIELTIPREVNGEILPCFDNIQQKRLIFVDDDTIGYFTIVDVSTDDSGLVPIKKVRGLSLETTLSSKRLTAFEGTVSLYNVTVPGSTDVINKILDLVPSWSVGSIDAELLSKYRTFDVSDTNIYNFLMTDVAEAFECIFTFDTINMTISATLIENATTDTDVYLSGRTVIDSSNFKEIADEITTALYVYGGGGLDIRTVNPLGTAVMYNFDYYKTTEWMSNGLISSIDSWETAVDNNQTSYANELALLKGLLEDVTLLEGELVELNTEWTVLEGLMKVFIEANEWPHQDTKDDMEAKENEISAKEVEITNKEAEITSSRAILESISDSLSFDNNFTTAQLIELEAFIFENTYQNENLVQLDSMTPEEIQELGQNLYDQAESILERLSQPRYEFTMDTASIFSLQEYSTFVSELELASVIYVERENGDVLYLALLELIYDYDNPDGFSMTFSNRLRLDNGEFVFSDLVGRPVKVGTTVSFDKSKWGNFDNLYKDEVSNFITSALDASKNAVINAENQEVTIAENGLRGKKYVSEGVYGDEEVWLTSNTIAFTDDAWNTASLAIGKIRFGELDLYGVVGEAIVGNLIAGNQLSIQNESLTFLVDGSGATLTDATLLVRSDKSRIFINPDDGIRIVTNDDGTWRKKFYVDTLGNINFQGTLTGADGDFSGTITATSGSIGGMDITSQGLYVDSSHYIYNNGNIRWGALTITGSTARFDGTISAQYLEGQLIDDQIDWNLGSGTTITWPGVTLGNTATGLPQLYGSTGVEFRTSGGTQFLIHGSGIMGGYSAGLIGWETPGNVNTNCGSFSIDYNTGSTSSYIYVGGAYPARRLKFHKGLYIGFEWA